MPTPCHVFQSTLLTPEVIAVNNDVSTVARNLK